MSLSYVFNKPVTNGNNGNVWNINDGVDSSRNQTFDYDKLNRIISFSSSFGGSRAYSIDLFGNRSCSSGCLSLSFDSFTNRITTTGYGYDAAGNMTTEPSRSYQYDAENRIKTVNSGSTATYSYDGEGRRVKKVSSTETRYYFYDPYGRPVWEYVPGTGWETFNLYFNGQHLATNDASDGLLFLHRDHLGTPRLKTNSSGAFHSDDHYYPYGQQIDTPTGSIHYRFTGKPRDTETGLDYFGARYYGSHLGRFTSIDPSRGSADPADPQTWNRYAYARNNPLVIVDPDGAVIETLWDLGNITIGVASFVSNVRAGNVGAAIIDAGGVVLDTVAAVTPLVPGGAGTAIKAFRSSEKVVDTIDTITDAAKAADQARDVRRSADFVVTPDGTALPVSQSRMREGFDRAGFPSRPATSRSEKGIIHEVPTKHGSAAVRTMEGGPKHPRRAVTTHPGTNDPVRLSGQRFRDNESRKRRRQESHLEQEP